LAQRDSPPFGERGGDLEFGSGKVAKRSPDWSGPRKGGPPGGPSDVVVGGGGLVSGRALFYVAISVAVLWEVLWVS
jgi:hypothetical protein